MDPEILRSQEDASANFVFRGDYPGFMEARYVRRSNKYFVVYLSSQSGCKQGCRMCHLTASRQTEYKNASLNELLNQANSVLDWYKENAPPAKIVHFNFMARGEFFDNTNLIQMSDVLMSRLGEKARQMGLFPRFLISTILPRCLKNVSLGNIFPIIHPEIYYSIYSVNPEFRQKWLPAALPVITAMTILKEYQELTSKIIKLHWAFIDNENDKEEDVEKICKLVEEFKLRVDVNIVRYNPYSKEFGQESPEETIMYNAGLIKDYLPAANVQIVKRVGFDVKASCGMFVEK